MIIFGIDPGTAVTGFGVIGVNKNAVSWIDSGVITTDAADSLANRLKCIFDSLHAKILIHGPQQVCIEQAFYAKNVHSTLVLGHARGVAMLAGAQAGAEILEFAPREIKKSVTGNGNAEKSQVEYMVKMILSPPNEHKHSDAYDALAVALCGFYNLGRNTILSDLLLKKSSETGLQRRMRVPGTNLKKGQARI